MPRINRQHSITKVYHIILRGIDKQDIFLDNQDYKKFLNVLVDTKEKYNYDIYAYCLMSNHVHILMCDGTNNLSKIMQSIEVSYSLFFNKKYGRVGHLFQNRFLSKKVEHKDYLMQVCKYIHKNPFKAGISAIEDYKWSSYKEYINENKIIKSDIVLNVLDSNKEEAKKVFIKIHEIQEKKDMYELLEYEMERKLTDEQVILYICEMLEIDNVHKILEMCVEKRDRAIAKIKERKEIPNTQISRILGINRKIIDRAK